MHTARFSDSGGSPYRDPSLGQRPQKEHGTRDRDPLEGAWDQAARQEVTSYRGPPRRKTPVKTLHITLPQTSFAGGKNKCQKLCNAMCNPLCGLLTLELCLHWGPPCNELHTKLYFRTLVWNMSSKLVVTSVFKIPSQFQKIIKTKFHGSVCRNWRVANVIILSKMSIFLPILLIWISDTISDKAFI